MSGERVRGVIYQSELCRLRSDIMKAEGDYLFVQNLTFPDGDDWKALNAAQIDMISAEVEVKPYYNFATMAANGKGQVSGDFPVYVNFYTGNTVGEKVPMNFSKIILSGKYAKGSATTGVKANFGPEYFKTVFKQTPTKEDEVTKSNIANKENSTGSIDDFVAQSDSIVLQKGRVVVCVRQADFHVAPENFLSAPNSEIDGGDSGSTAGAILKHLRGKAGKAVEEEPRGKKGRKNPNPTPSTNDYLYPEDPVIIGEGASAEKSLIIDYPFWVIIKYTFDYIRS